MNHIISEIVTSELGESIESVFEITDLGSVNKVYDVTCKYANYIIRICLLYTSPSPRDRTRSRMPSSA